MPKPTPGPRSSHRPGDAGSTNLGLYGEAPVASVDRGGAITLAGESWSVDWWIGAEDRWHVPNVEPAVRQQRLGPGPVIETSIRIPGGDCTQRVWATRTSGDVVVVVEVQNKTATPVALAVAIAGGRADATGVKRGSFRLVPQKPARDVREDLGALVVPLPHSATQRFVLAPKKMAALVDVASVPDAATTQRGWQAVLDSAGSAVLPDSGLSAQFDVARARVLAEAPFLPGRIQAFDATAGNALGALAAGGFGQETRQILGELSGWFINERNADPIGCSAVLSGLADALWLHVDHAGAEHLMELALQLTTRAARSKDPAVVRTAEAALARIALLAGQTEAAVSIDRDCGFGTEQGAGTDQGSRLDQLSGLFQQAGESASWGDDEVAPAAEFVRGIHAMLTLPQADGLDLLPGFPAAWRGGSLETHDIPTVHGRISFALRWHGHRPALLWDLKSSRSPVKLRCTALDPAWSTTDAKGETLLAGSAQELGPAPAAGTSFS